MKAHDLARQWHGEQKRFDGRPYIIHPEAVAITVMRFTTDENIVASAYLHDVVEDTGIGLDEIEFEFNKSVANTVKNLTNTPSEVGFGNRLEYLKNKLMSMDDDTLLIKLADRLHNVSEMHMTSQEFRTNYTDETRRLMGHVLSERSLTADHLILINEILQKLPIHKNL